MGVVSHWYFNASAGQTVADSAERILLMGGYGGWVQGLSARYDGYYARSDIWESYDGNTWRQLKWNSTLGGRAWMGMAVMPGPDVRLDILGRGAPATIYVLGGGYIGFKAKSNRKVTSMSAYADLQYSTDGVTWTRVNFQEGGGSSTITFYSSQEWALTTVNGATKYLGMWGVGLLAHNMSVQVCPRL